MFRQMVNSDGQRPNCDALQGALCPLPEMILVVDSGLTFQA